MLTVDMRLGLGVREMARVSVRVELGCGHEARFRGQG